MGSNRAVLALVLTLVSAGIHAEAPASRFIVLGSSSGPIGNAERAQPANVLQYGEQTLLIDAGDGAMDQLAKAGLDPAAVQGVLITHLHFDHTGGLFALLGRRYQLRLPGTLTLYGPPGLKRTIEALQAAMQPMIDANASGKLASLIPQPKATAGIQVIELTDKSQFGLGAIRITAAANSHYALGEKDAVHSLAYRFDLPDRSIVYTGDTGPSESVEKLAADANLLVTETMDADKAMDQLQKQRPDLNFVVRMAIKQHFSKQHLSPAEAGLMAKHAGVKALVLTHDALPRDFIESARKAIAQNYSGPITFAHDLQVF